MAEAYTRTQEARPPEGMLRLFQEGTPQNVGDLAFEIATEIEATWKALETDGG